MKDLERGRGCQTEKGNELKKISARKMKNVQILTLLRFGKGKNLIEA